MKYILILLVFFNLQAFSQDSSYKFSFAFSLGGGFASEAKYSVYDYGRRNTELINYLPDLSGKLGITYGRIANIYDLNLRLILEAGYFSASTSKFGFQLQEKILHGITKQRIIPITISLLLDNNNTLSPIIKIGLGLGNKKFTEEYENYNQLDIKAEKWFFILIGGAGLAYKINSSFELALIFETTILDGDLTGENSLGFKNGLQGIQINTYFGLQFSYSVNI